MKKAAWLLIIVCVTAILCSCVPVTSMVTITKTVTGPTSTATTMPATVTISPSTVTIPPTTVTVTTTKTTSTVVTSFITTSITSTTTKSTVTTITTATTISTGSLTQTTIVQPVTTTQTTQSEPILKTFHWTYDGSNWTWELQIPQYLYDTYKILPRDFPESYYSVFVTHPLDDEYITGLAGKIKAAAQEKKYDEMQTVSLAVSFVQNLPYTSDSVSTGYDEYPRYPIETLVDGGGDCEDTAILLASLIRAMGYSTVLIIYPGTAENTGHCAVGIKGGEGIYGTYYLYNGEKYYYIETTNTGWEIGEIPDKYKGVSAYVYPMIPVPVFTHTWTTESSFDRIKLIVKVTNSGSETAKGVYIHAGFDAGNNQLWNSQKSPQFDIGIDQSYTVTLYLVPPQNVYTRLVVIVVYDGYSVDESYSLWYNT